jgi:uncharacterized protein (TIGR03437 family)
MTHAKLTAFILCSALPLAAGVPLHFEANRGQAPDGVLYIGRAGDQALYLTASEAVIAMSDPNGAASLRLSLKGAQAAEVSGGGQLAGKANYLIGRDPGRWRTEVPIYRSVRYRGVYPGIDLVFHGNQAQVEYDFEVAAGADPSLIRLRFAGARNAQITATGDLLFRLAGGRTVRQHRPVVYQDVEGRRQNVAGSYRWLGRRGASFEVAIDLGAYDRSRTLVIDPVLSFSTYFGGATATSSNEARAVAVDLDGNVYIAGRTFSSTMPVTPGVVQTTYRGSADMYVAKLDASGSAIIYCTYLGGAGDEQAFSLAVDDLGNAYVAGETRSDNFPTANPVQATRGGGYDAVVAKLNAAGTALVYSTYLGGSADDRALGIALDNARAAYVTGGTVSTNFPVRNALQATLAPSGSTAAREDMFVTKFDPQGGLAYSTYYGGSGTERGQAIAVDPSGAAHITGRTDTGFPTTAGTFQGAGPCPSTIPVLKLNPTGGLAYAACFAGRSGGEGYAILADKDGLTVVVGGTTSGATGFPLVSSLQQPGGGEDAFLTIINASGSTLLYSTLLGGSSTDRATSVATDVFGSLFVAGWTNSAQFPTSNALQGALGAGGGHNAFVTKIKPDGTGLLWSTYLGGSGGSFDESTGMATDYSGNAYVTGTVGSMNFPTANALQATRSPGASQSFITRIGETPVVPANGILGGAAFTAGLTPGAIVSLFGNYLAASVGFAAALPLPTKLAGATVRVNGVSAPLYYTSPTQINFQMPYEVQGGSAQVTVTLANLTSAPVTIPVAASAPGIFTADSSGQGQGVVVNAVTNVLAAPAGSIPGANTQPIAKGQFATIYASGLGAVTNPPASGAPASGTNLSTTIQLVTVNLGGVAVTPSFAGLVPGLVGLYQVNFQVPANAPSGNAVALSLSVGGSQSNTVTMAVAP